MAQEKRPGHLRPVPPPGGEAVAQAEEPVEEQGTPG